MKAADAIKGQRVQMNALGRRLHQTKAAIRLPQRGIIAKKPNAMHIWAGTIVVRFDGSRGNRTVPAIQWEAEPQPDPAEPPNPGNLK